ncbi:carbohydrate ABC transporter permease [Cohnella boryungensis]|uniref:Carbohydrate ABC transporter permease n=1 Tax=Cohnella boryungensis TaxID=768479 RepID=A0ABV8S639_9BACL
MEMAKRKIGDKWIAYAFMAPALILVVLVSFYPIGVAMRWSLYETEYVRTGAYVGADNFISIFKNESGLTNIKNSFVYVFGSILIVIPLSTLLAVLLNMKVKFRVWFRTAIILPWVISQTVTALLWKWLINANYGPVNYIVEQLGGTKIDPLSTSTGANIALIVANVWNTFPIALILILAALQTISSELYEAGRVDGATGWKSFTRITLPLIKPTIAVTLIMLSLEYFNMVTLIYVFTGGGPFSATETLSLRAFKEGFEYWNIGLGSAFSVLLFAFNLLLSLIYVRALKSKD